MTTLTLAKARILSVKVANGKPIELDLVDACQVVADIGKEHEADRDRMVAMQAWMTKAMGLKPGVLDLNAAVTLWDTINEEADEMLAERKKKVSETVTSLRSTRESQTGTGNGTPKKKKRGLPTSRASGQRSQSRKAGSTTAASTGSTKPKSRARATKKKRPN